MLEEINQWVDKARNGTLLTQHLTQQLTPRDATKTNRPFMSGLQYQFESFEKHTIPFFVTMENLRRLAVTAMTIKQYELETGKWPAQLSDLHACGLSSADYTSVGGNQFGYEIAPTFESQSEERQAESDSGNQQGFAWLFISKPDGRARQLDIHSPPTFDPHRHRSTSQYSVIRIR